MECSWGQNTGDVDEPDDRTRETKAKLITKPTDVTHIVEAQVCFFLIHANIKKFILETYLDMDKYEGQSSFNF